MGKKNNKIIDKNKELQTEKLKKLELKKREIIHKKLLENEEINRKLPKEAPKDAMISLQNINMIYPNHFQAVYNFNLDIKEKEFIVLVGPSGCGKSTTLRMIAGLEDITAGDLYINNKYANDLEPKERGIAMVFQSYALYPNMTVFENMAFGLEMQHYKQDYIDEQVSKAAKILGLEEYLDNKPSELSGGQRQRVALGRAIVKNAKVFLMDEPLSNLDAKLRVQMRSQIVRIHRELGATTVYVTHDQTEAMTMGNRIVVMKDGKVQQIGTPKEIYNNPINIFVATFIGSPGMNIFDVTYDHGNVNFGEDLQLNLSNSNIIDYDNFYENKIKFYKEEIKKLNDELNSFSKETTEDFDSLVEIAKHDIEVNEDLLKKYSSIKDNGVQNLTFGIRPEDIAQVNYDQLIMKKSKSLSTNIIISELLGNEYFVHSSINKQEFVAKISANHEVLSEGEIEIVFDLNKIHLFDSISKERIF